MTTAGHRAGQRDGAEARLLPLFVAAFLFHLLLFWLLGRLKAPPEHKHDIVDMVEVHHAPPPPTAPKTLPPVPPPPPPTPLPQQRPIAPLPVIAHAPNPPATPPPPPPPGTPPPPPPSFGVSIDSTIDDPDAVAVPLGDTLEADPSTAGHPHPGQRTAQPAALPGPVVVEGGPPQPPPPPPVHIAQFPRKLKDAPQLDCPAFASGELSPPQEVKLEVAISADGTITSVAVKDGIGHGCDDVARSAVSQLAFAPAVGSDGKPMAAKITYLYDFDAEN